MSESQVVAPNILRDVARHCGLTPTILSEYFGVPESDVRRWMADTGTVAMVSRLFRALNVRMSVPMSREVTLSFRCEVLSRVFRDPAWRARHELLPWCNTNDEFLKMLSANYRKMPGSKLARLLNSQLFDYPASKWNERNVGTVIERGNWALKPISEQNRAAFVLKREMITSFASPKVFDYLHFETDSDPLTVTIKPCPELVHLILIDAAKRLDHLHETVSQSNAGEV